MTQRLMQGSIQEEKHNIPDGDPSSYALPVLRLDKWLWFARFFHSRAEAAQMCMSRHLRMDGRVIEKAHAPVRPGAVLSFPKGQTVVVVRVEGLPRQRSPLLQSQDYFSELRPALR